MSFSWEKNFEKEHLKKKNFEFGSNLVQIQIHHFFLEIVIKTNSNYSKRLLDYSTYRLSFKSNNSTTHVYVILQRETESRHQQEWKCTPVYQGSASGPVTAIELQCRICPALQIISMVKTGRNSDHKRREYSHKRTCGIWICPWMPHSNVTVDPNEKQ